MNANIPAATSRPAVAREVRAAIRAWERRHPAKGGCVDLSVARRHMGRAKGYSVRLLSGSLIIADWRCGAEADAEACYLAVMQALAGMDGFRGVTGTSGDGEIVTGEMLREYLGRAGK